MKKATILMIEGGILLGILVAALALPPSTPLFAFAVIGAMVFVIGNSLLFAGIRGRKRPTESNPEFWIRILRVYGFVVAAWLCWLIAKRLT